MWRNSMLAVARRSAQACTNAAAQWSHANMTTMARNHSIKSLQFVPQHFTRSRFAKLSWSQKHAVMKGCLQGKRHPNSGLLAEYVNGVRTAEELTYAMRMLQDFRRQLAPVNGYVVAALVDTANRVGCTELAHQVASKPDDFALPPSKEALQRVFAQQIEDNDAEGAVETVTALVDMGVLPNNRTQKQLRRVCRDAEDAPAVTAAAAEVMHRVEWHSEGTWWYTSSWPHMLANGEHAKVLAQAADLAARNQMLPGLQLLAAQAHVAAGDVAAAVDAVAEADKASALRTRSRTAGASRKQQREAEASVLAAAMDGEDDDVKNACVDVFVRGGRYVALAAQEQARGALVDALAAVDGSSEHLAKRAATALLADAELVAAVEERAGGALPDAVQAHMKAFAE